MSQAAAGASGAAYLSVGLLGFLHGCVPRFTVLTIARLPLPVLLLPACPIVSDEWGAAEGGSVSQSPSLLITSSLSSGSEMNNN